MWLYWCLLSTIISGFTSIAMKKCPNNEPKRIAIMGLLSYHSIMILVSLIIYPEFILQLNFKDIITRNMGNVYENLGNLKKLRKLLTK